MLKLLIAGARTEQDVTILERRHVIPLVVAFHDSSLASDLDKVYCYKFLRTLSQQPQRFSELLIRSGIHSWLFTTIQRTEDPTIFRSLVITATNLVRHHSQLRLDNAQTQNGGHSSNIAVDMEMWQLGDIVMEKTPSLLLKLNSMNSTRPGSIKVTKQIFLSDVSQFLISSRSKQQIVATSLEWSLPLTATFCTFVADTLRVLQWKSSKLSDDIVMKLQNYLLDVIHLVALCWSEDEEATTMTDFWGVHDASSTSRSGSSTPLVEIVLSLLDAQESINVEKQVAVDFDLRCKVLRICLALSQGSSVDVDSPVIVKRLLNRYYSIGRSTNLDLETPALTVLNQLTRCILGRRQQSSSSHTEPKLGSNLVKDATSLHEQLLVRYLTLLRTQDNTSTMLDTFTSDALERMQEKSKLLFQQLRASS